jgi:hypothetical protein
MMSSPIRIIVILAATLMTKGWSPGAAAQDMTPAGPAERVPVTLSLASGVSEGSYQAGVGWAVTTFLRGTRDDPAFRGRYRSVAPHHLTIVTGSSAGNINALLAAMEWCRSGSAVPVEASLFWRTWTRVGWEQLFPRHYRESAGALFHRAYFHERLYPELLEVFAQEQIPGCSVLIGIPITRIGLSTVRLNDRLAVPTQRHVVVFAAGADEGENGRGGGMILKPPPSPVMAAGSVGKLMLLPPAADGVGGRIDPVSALALLEAASAFPGVFSLRPLTLIDPWPDSTDGRCVLDEHGQCHVAEPFTDGGLFDRSPLPLAFSLIHAEGRGHAWPLVIFVDAEQRRGALGAARNPASGGLPGGGVHALQALARGMVPTARGYEMHAFARDLAGYPPERRDALRPTTRAFPIFGEQLFKLGGFLGRVFREHDFYVGVYDGLRFASHDVVCNGATHPICADTVLAELIEDDALPLDSHLRSVLRGLHALERFGTLPAPETESPHQQVLAVLLAATARAFLEGVREDCPSRTYAAAALCAGGFGAILADFATPEVRRWAAGWAGRPECGHAHYLSAPDHCEADETLFSLLRNPELHVHRMIEQALERSRLVELQLARDGAHHHLATAEFAQLLYHSSPRRYKRRFEPNMSTIPDHARASARTLRLLPYYGSITLGATGWETAWQPTVRLGGEGTVPRSLEGLQFRFGHLHNPRGEAGDRHFVFGGVGQILDLNSFILTTADYGGEYVQSVGGRGRPALSAGIEGFGGKLRLGGRWFVLGNDTGYQGGRAAAVSIGIADLNGLVYWSGRSVRHRLQLKGKERSADVRGTSVATGAHNTYRFPARASRDRDDSDGMRQQVRNTDVAEGSDVAAGHE